jgi:hypothetical protein
MSHPWALDFSSIADDISVRSKNLQIEPYGYVEAKVSETVRKTLIKSSINYTGTKIHSKTTTSYQ